MTNTTYLDDPWGKQSCSSPVYKSISIYIRLTYMYHPLFKKAVRTIHLPKLQWKIHRIPGCTWTPGNPPVSTDTSLGKTSAILVTVEDDIFFWWYFLGEMFNDLGEMFIIPWQDLCHLWTLLGDKLKYVQVELFHTWTYVRDWISNKNAFIPAKLNMAFLLGRSICVGYGKLHAV